MSLEWFVARRYLLSRERNALISVNTLISVLGVAVGVAALVVVIGVMDGAFKLLSHQITSIAPHIRLMAWDPAAAGDMITSMLMDIKKRPEVARVDMIICKQGLIQSGRGARAPKQGIELFGLDQVALDGPFTFNLPKDFKPVTLHENEIALGKPLANKLNARVGSPVRVIIQSERSTTQVSPFSAPSFVVAAIVECGYYEFDAHTAFVSNATLRKMFPAAGPGANPTKYISIRLNDPMQANAFRDSLNVPNGWNASTWQDESASFLASLKIQKYGLFIILSLIILVSAFNIIGTLILMVTEKTRAIGILSAVGASRGFVGRLFLFIGMLIGLTGTGLGLVLGIIIASLVPYAPIKMPEAIYNFNRLPMEIRPLTLLSIAVAALVICTIGSLIPAWQAARLNPAEAVRYD